MGQRTLGEVRDGSGPSVRSGTGGGPLGRSGTIQRTFGEVRDWSGDPRGGLGQIGVPREGPRWVG